MANYKMKFEMGKQSKFILCDGRVVKMKLNEAENLEDCGIFFRFDSDGIMITADNAVNPYGEVCSVPDAIVGFQKMDYESSVVYVYRELGVAGKSLVTVRDILSFTKLVSMINSGKWELEVNEETYGREKAILSGYLHSEKQHWECSIEIAYFGEMTYSFNRIEE